MRVEILGSGGAFTTPRPGCDCRVCVRARRFGVPFSRTGPSVFLHGPDVLIDTPEESKDQINRSSITRINACFYSHWHPDHTMGRRVFETRNFLGSRGSGIEDWPAAAQTTRVYLPEHVGEDARHWLGMWEHLTFMQSQGLVDVVELRDGESVEIEGVRITPFTVAVGYVYAFLFQDDRSRVLIAPDELVGWSPPSHLRGIDLAVLPMGVVEHHPLTGERQIAERHPLLTEEATFAETLRMARALEAKRTVLTHIEEMDGLSFDDLLLVARQLQAGGLAVEFAYDTMLIDVD